MGGLHAFSGRRTAAAVWLGLVGILPALASAQGPPIHEVGPGLPITSIQEGIDEAKPGDIIRVHPGTYAETVSLTGKWLLLVAADSTAPPIVAVPVDTLKPALLVTGPDVDARTRITGFVFRGGRGWIDPTSQESFGGAVAVLDGASPTFSRCTLDSSTADWGGGLAARNAGAITLERLVIADCTAVEGGGGLYLDGDSLATLTFLTVDRNQAPVGGGLLNARGNHRLVNSIVTRSQGSGLTATGGGLTSDYNDLWANTPGHYQGVPLGAHDLIVDPRFVAGDPYDRHLTLRSPAIDAADPAAPVPPGGGARADLGAFEFGVGPQFIAAQSTDPDRLYKNGDTVRFQVEWAADSTLTVSMITEGLLAGLDSAPVRGTVTSIATTDPTRFRFALSAAISEANTIADQDSIVLRATATTNAGGSTTAEVLVVSLDNTPPPPPVLDPPVRSTTVPSVLLSGRVDRTRGADSVVARVNGDDAAFGRPDSAGRFSLNVPITVRENRLTALALDRAGNPSRETIGRSVDYLPSLLIEVPKQFHPGDQFIVGSPTPPSSVEIRIVNLAGQLIRVLRGGGQELVELPWDARNEQGQSVNAGPYLVRIQIEIPGQGTQVDERPILLAKGGTGS